MCEFECGACVVIQTANQPVVQRERHAHRLHDCLYFLEVLTARLVEKLADTGKFLDDRLILRNLAVEDAQRVGHGAALAIDAHSSHHRLKRFPKSLVEGGAIVSATD